MVLIFSFVVIVANNLHICLNFIASKTENSYKCVHVHCASEFVSSSFHTPSVCMRVISVCHCICLSTKHNMSHQHIFRLINISWIKDWIPPRYSKNRVQQNPRVRRETTINTYYVWEVTWKNPRCFIASLDFSGNETNSLIFLYDMYVDIIPMG